jgi:glyoxylase-like metal-dependent hydrolase (beta-lactamase superfamily II)
MAGTVDAPPDLLRVVTAPNPSPFTLDGTNTYVLGRGQVVVIDPGPEVAEHVEAVLETAGQAGRVALIVVTHSHRDHTGAVSPLVAATGAPVRQWGRGEGPLADGEVLSTGGATLWVLHTPGHAPDHVAFYWEEERVLFSGDLVLGRGTVVVAPPSGSMEDYLRSLDRVADLDLRMIAPGHGPLIWDPAGWIRGYVDHRRERERQILQHLADGPRTPAELVGLIYVSLDPRLRGAAEATVEAHLVKLLREGAVRREGDRYAQV